MAFRDWADTEAADPLELPINGKRYRMPELGHLDAIRLREEFARVQAGETPELSNDDFLRMILGDQFAAMRADNVPDKAIVHAATVSYTDWMHGRVAAENLWEHGPDPKALAEAIRKFAEGSTTSPSSAADGSSTKPRASTSGTRSRKKAAATTGPKSSPNPG